MKTLVIYTGGTIGMIKHSETGSLVPGGVVPIKKFIIEENLQHNLDVITTKTAIDSSNFNKLNYKEVSLLVKENYNTYDGILILMGTDTMAYVASLFSFCIKGLVKPIVFTGGQLPLNEVNSDSKKNLKDAIIGLKHNNFPKEVGVYFNNNWHRAVNTIKVDSKNKEAYSTYNVKNNTIDFVNDVFSIETNLKGNISVFKFHPWQNLDLLKSILDTKLLDGVVLEVYGAGNMPVFDTELKQIIDKSIKRGVRIVVVTQCLIGGITAGKYDASNYIKELNFINGGTMSTECALAKLLFAITKKMNIQEIDSFFSISVRGE